jgi:hypothetical protein
MAETTTQMSIEEIIKTEKAFTAKRKADKDAGVANPTDIDLGAPVSTQVERATMLFAAMYDLTAREVAGLEDADTPITEAIIAQEELRYLMIGYLHLSGLRRLCITDGTVTRILRLLLPMDVPDVSYEAERRAILSLIHQRVSSGKTVQSNGINCTELANKIRRHELSHEDFVKQAIDAFREACRTADPDSDDVTKMDKRLMTAYLEQNEDKVVRTRTSKKSGKAPVTSAPAMPATRGAVAPKPKAPAPATPQAMQAEFELTEELTLTDIEQLAKVRALMRGKGRKMVEAAISRVEGMTPEDILFTYMHLGAVFASSEAHKARVARIMAPYI